LGLGAKVKYLSLPDLSGNVIIEKNVWVGGNSIILHGVTIGEGSIVSANSVVTKDIPDNTVAYGIPAKYVRDIHYGQTSPD